MSDTPSGRFVPDALADVVIPSAPAVWGERIVHVVQRTDRETKKHWSSLWVVCPKTGATRRLTQGDFHDRMPRADRGGRFVVFVSDRTGSDQIHRLDADGGEARQLTALPRGAIGGLRVSPDGSRLLIVLSPAPAEDDSLPLAADLACGPAPDELAGVIDGAGAGAKKNDQTERATPRARVTARLHNREDGRGWFGGRQHIWLIDCETGRARRVTSGEHDFDFPAWLPCGRALVACMSGQPTDVVDCDGTRNDLVRIDLENGRIELLPKPDGAAMAPSVSPRGDWVAYSLWQPDDVFGHENPVLWISPIGAGEARPLTADLDRPVMDLVLDDLVGSAHSADRPLWREAGDCIVVSVSDAGAVRLWEQPLDGTAGRYLTDENHAVLSPSAFGDGEIVFCLSSRASFPEIGSLGADGSLRSLTAHNAAVSERCAPRAPERVSIDHDGVRIWAYWYPPRSNGSGKAPALLYIHGGPCVAYGERLFFEMQWLADLGYGVLCPNPRGSHSYGLAYTSAIRGRWGEPDRADQLAFVDWLRSRAEIDPERIAVLGGSYGGYMTLLMAATTNCFRTAIAERGLYNWCSLVGSSDFGHCHARIFDGKWPWDDPERYLIASPIRLVGSVEIPTLVIHYEGDLRVGPEQGLQLFNALKLRGVPTALLLFPDENHGMTRAGRIDRRLERFRQIEAWLERWLRN